MHEAIFTERKPNELSKCLRLRRCCVFIGLGCVVRCEMFESHSIRSGAERKQSAWFWWRGDRRVGPMSNELVFTNGDKSRNEANEDVAHQTVNCDVCGSTDREALMLPCCVSLIAQRVQSRMCQLKPSTKTQRPSRSQPDALGPIQI